MIPRQASIKKFIIPAQLVIQARVGVCPTSLNGRSLETLSFPDLRRHSIPLELQQTFRGISTTSGRCNRGESPAFMATTDTITHLKKGLNGELLEKVRTLWFQHLNGEESSILPGQGELKQWFSKNVELDRACVANFGHVLEIIHSINVTASDILSAVQPSSSLDWLSLVLLFDQISRNCYRGLQSSVVFTYFDPLALDISLRAREVGILEDPQVRYQFAYRTWFLLPMMHSEQIEIHAIAIREFQRLSDDVEELLADPTEISSIDPKKLKYRSVLAEKKEAAKALSAIHLEFEIRHQKVIERFGRYPHRNKILGRLPTEEETQYLEDGGETFDHCSRVP
ncbi:Bacterial protein of unknown function (DUF924) domain containing protein [Elaphomyces granulatus]